MATCAGAVASSIAHARRQKRIARLTQGLSGRHIQARTRPELIRTVGQWKSHRGKPKQNSINDMNTILINKTDGAFGGTATFGSKALPFVRSTQFDNCCGAVAEGVRNQISGEQISSYDRKVSRDQQRLFWEALMAGLPLTIKHWQA